MNVEDRLKKEAEEKLKKISKAFEWLRGEKVEREAELKTSKESLPEILANWALGDVPFKRVTELKMQISKAQEFLDDYDIIIEALNGKNAQAWTTIKNADRIKEKREKYEALKVELKAEYSFSLTERLQDLARTLDADFHNLKIEGGGVEEDCEQFLAKLEKARAE